MATATPRPYAAYRRTTKDKIHRRQLRLDRREFSVLSLRPDVRHRFATNYFHDTWHIVCHAGSAHYLARLLWALSFQRRSNTTLVIDQPFLVTNPFDGDASRPFAFVNSDLTNFNQDQARALQRRLPVGGGRDRRRPDGTVVMNSQSRPAAVERTDGYAECPFWAENAIAAHETNGLIVFAMPAKLLRSLSLRIDSVDDTSYYSDAVFFDDDQKGEIQTFDNFSRRVSDAKRKRQKYFPDQGSRPLTIDEKYVVWFN